MENKETLLDLFISYKNDYIELLNDKSSNSNNLISFKLDDLKVKKTTNIINPNNNDEWKTKLTEYELEQLNINGIEYFFNQRKKERELHIIDEYEFLDSSHIIEFSTNKEENIKLNLLENDFFLEYINKEPLLIEEKIKTYYQNIFLQKELDKESKEYKYYKYIINCEDKDIFLDNIDMNLNQLELLFDYEKEEIKKEDFESTIDLISNELTIKKFKEQNLILTLNKNELNLIFTKEQKEFINMFVSTSLYEKYIDQLEEIRIEKFKTLDKKDFKNYFLSNVDFFLENFKLNDFQTMKNGLIYSIKLVLIDFSKNRNFKEFIVCLNEIKDNNQQFFVNNKNIILEKLYFYLELKEQILIDINIINKLDDNQSINRETYLSLYNKTLDILNRSNLKYNLDQKQTKLFHILKDEMNKLKREEKNLEKNNLLESFFKDIKETYDEYKNNPNKNKFNFIKIFAFSNYLDDNKINYLLKNDSSSIINKNKFEIISNNFKFIIDINNETILKYKYNEDPHKQKEIEAESEKDSNNYQNYMTKRNELRQKLITDNPTLTKDEIRTKLDLMIEKVNKPSYEIEIMQDEFIEAFNLKKYNLENTKLFSLMTLMEINPIDLLNHLDIMRKQLSKEVENHSIDIKYIKETNGIKLYTEIKNCFFNSLKKQINDLINDLNNKYNSNSLSNEEINTLNFNLDKIENLKYVENLIDKYYSIFIKSETYGNDFNFLNKIFKENELTDYNKKIITNVFGNYFYLSLEKSFNLVSNYSNVEKIGKEVFFDQYTLAKLLVIVGSQTSEDILELEKAKEKDKNIIKEIPKEVLESEDISNLFNFSTNNKKKSIVDDDSGSESGLKFN